MVAEGLGLEVARELRCEHQTEALAKHIAQALASGSDLVLVVGASAIVDRRDVIPAAIASHGGEIARFGREANLQPWDLERIAETDYDPTDYQPTVFVGPSFERVLDDISAWCEGRFGV